MNGRLYDPVLRSFLMPDNFIQQPENTQNYNRYAYVLNNPLMYTDPSGEIIPFLAAVAIGAGIGAFAYTMTALLADVPFSVGGLLKATFIGAATAAATFGIGQAASCLFSTPAVGFLQGAYQGAVIGSITGVGGVVSNAIFNGQNITLKAVLGGAMTGAVIGSVLGGIQGGIRAQKAGLSFWKGDGISASDVTEPIITSSEGGVSYSNKSARAFSDNHEELNRLSKNVNYLYAVGSAPTDYGYTSNNNILVNQSGKEVYGVTVTRSSGWFGLKREISVYLSKNAFVSKTQLYMIMHHEYMHSFFSFYGISVANQGHDIIHKWNYDQAMKWGISANYNNQSYYSQSYNTPLPIYEKYGFKIINYLP